MPYDSVSISQWVKVLYEGEVFLGKLLNKENNTVLVRCLSKPSGITEQRDLERENDVVYHNHVYHKKVNPMLLQVGHIWKYTYKMKD